MGLLLSRASLLAWLCALLPFAICVVDLTAKIETETIW